LERFNTIGHDSVCPKTLFKCSQSTIFKLSMPFNSTLAMWFRQRVNSESVQTCPTFGPRGDYYSTPARLCSLLSYYGLICLGRSIRQLLGNHNSLARLIQNENRWSRRRDTLIHWERRFKRVYGYAVQLSVWMCVVVGNWKETNHFYHRNAICHSHMAESRYCRVVRRTLWRSFVHRVPNHRAQVRIAYYCQQSTFRETTWRNQSNTK
jgi:hypothetical protein